jgi:hypothetical protein
MGLTRTAKDISWEPWPLTAEIIQSFQVSGDDLGDLLWIRPSGGVEGHQRNVMGAALAVGQENPASRLSATNTRCSVTIGRWRFPAFTWGPSNEPRKVSLWAGSCVPKVSKPVCDGFFETVSYLAH